MQAQFGVPAEIEGTPPGTAVAPVPVMIHSSCRIAENALLSVLSRCENTLLLPAVTDTVNGVAPVPTPNVVTCRSLAFVAVADGTAEVLPVPNASIPLLA